MKIRIIKDILFWAFIFILPLAWLIPVFHMISTILIKGFNVLREAGLSFIFDTPGSPLSGDIGGIGPAIVGSLLTVSLASLITIPLALSVGILISEYPNSIISRIVYKVSTLLMQVPTIIVSMVVYATVVIKLGTFSALAASLALSMVMLPYMACSVADVLRSIPLRYREAGLALGLSKFKTIMGIVMDIGRRGIIASIILGLARIIGETAPLLFTAGGLRRTYPKSILSPVDSIPLLIYYYAQAPYEFFQKLAWGAAFILLLVVFTLFTIPKILVKEVRL